MSIESIIGDVIAFRDDRDWAQFHTPNNLAATLSIEAAELQETMLRKTSAEIDEMKKHPAFVKTVADEIAEVRIYSTRQ